MKIFLIYLTSFLVLFSCGRGNQDPTSSSILHDEIMVVHDEVMPEISTIHRLKKKLNAIENGDESRIQILILNLDEADESMMSWMADYKRPKGVDSLALTYLASEKEKIDLVSGDMKLAIHEGQDYLTELNSTQ